MCTYASLPSVPEFVTAYAYDRHNRSAAGNRQQEPKIVVDSVEVGDHADQAELARRGAVQRAGMRQGVLDRSAVFVMSSCVNQPESWSLLETGRPKPAGHIVRKPLERLGDGTIVKRRMTRRASIGVASRQERTAGNEKGPIIWAHPLFRVCGQSWVKSQLWTRSRISRQPVRFGWKALVGSMLRKASRC